jgi:mono/diheme cytochrome c family protein
MMKRLGAAQALPGLAVLLLLILAASPAPGGGADGPRPAPAVDFNRDVRPILSETCFQCHGPDKAKRKGSLRLDTREGAFADAESGGPVIVAGKPDESEIVARIVSDDPDEKMPPPKSGRSLTKAQTEVIRRWVAEGAQWKGHWSYIPPARPVPPDVSRLDAPAGFVRNDVDRFLLAKLVEKGLTPSPEADRITLIRRLSFDLRGLPPTTAEVDSFVNDKAADAYETLVERMLASPQYGERMAIYWLDLVRYADTTGYHNDVHRDVALFRDYVIDAFNTNLPFDRFTTEQLAGDLLPGAGDRQRIASGYNKLLLTTAEGGGQAKEYYAKYAADRVRNASTVWMGATLGCAECHDHKFDPFTTRDFYNFAAFFADIQEAAIGEPEKVKIPTAEQSARASSLAAELKALKAALDTTTPALAEAQAAWERTSGSHGHDPEWSVLKPESAVSEAGATLTLLGDGAVLASGKSPDRDSYTLKVKSRGKVLSALRLEVIPDGKLPNLGPGRADNGNFVLSEFQVKEGGTPIAWSNVTATFAQASFPVVNATDGKLDTGWAVAGETSRPNLAVFEAKTDLGADCDCEPGAETRLTVTLRFNHGDRHTLGRFRLSGTDAPRPVRVGPMPEAVAKALATPAESRSADHKTTLAAYYRSIAPALEPTRAKLAEVKKAQADLDAAMPRTLVTRAGTPRMMRVLPRGNWLDDSGPVVSPSVPAFLKGSAPEGKSTRLDLAKWIVARDNPLTARVFVNRLWKLTFGQGIVATPDDLGAQGTWPTHPELLDWLAVEFMDRGWDVKQMVRLLVLSGAYRQTSHASEGLRHDDPYNQWLARQARFRVDAEMVRDTALAVSGLLAAQVGGPSAKPYQPAGYWAHLNFPKREYEADHGAGLYRRGLYTYWCRTFLHPSLQAFDAPSREECTVARPRSNTPLQALVLLNDPIYVESARALAERTIREGGGDVPARVDWVYRTVLSRAPRASEAALVAALVEKHQAQYRSDRAAADALIHTGERPVAADLDPAELAAWTSVARVVLNLHETITRN